MVSISMNFICVKTLFVFIEKKFLHFAAKTDIKDVDGCVTRIMSIFSKNGNNPSHQWACRTFLSAENTTVSLKRRSRGEPFVNEKPPHR